MTTEKFAKVYAAIERECREVLLTKARQYAGQGDRLHNFRVAAAMNSTSAEEALWGMLSKHIVSLRDLCLGLCAANDTFVWREKIVDTINYLVLLAALTGAFEPEAN